MTPDPDVVLISVPGSAEFLRLIRLAAADAATRADLDIDETDNVRIAVDELCTALSEGRADRRVHLELRTGNGQVEVSGSCSGPSPFELGELARIIVGAAVDEYEIECQGGTRTFVLRKSIPD